MTLAIFGLADGQESSRNAPDAANFLMATEKVDPIRTFSFFFRNTDFSEDKANQCKTAITQN